MNGTTNRRSFLSVLGLGAAGFSFLPHSRSNASAVSSAWDLAWLDEFTGKHRQVFDLGGRHPTISGNPLRVPKNWLNAHKEVYGLGDRELSTCVGIAGAAFAMNAGDDAWKKYPIGEHFQIKDPETGTWSKRNLWLEPTPGIGADVTIRALQARGTVFWQCNNALNGVVKELADRTGGKLDTIRADLVAGLNPGVKLVPAHTMLLGLVQERKFTYESL